MRKGRQNAQKTKYNEILFGVPLSENRMLQCVSSVSSKLEHFSKANVKIAKLKDE
jgi:hypothetical protein